MKEINKQNSSYVLSFFDMASDSDSDPELFTEVSTGKKIK